MPGKKGMKHYPAFIKEQAVRMHLEEGRRTSEIMKVLGIDDESRVRKWCKRYPPVWHGVLDVSKAQRQAKEM